MNNRPSLNAAARIAIPLVGILLAVLMTHGSTGDEPELPYQLRQDLAAALKAKANDLWEQKNEEGLHYMRGSYPKQFRKIDDGTYEAMFAKDIAGTDRMRTERYLVTLKGSGARWEVADEELEGTYEKLIRDVPGDETFHRFDSFDFDHEGMHITAGPGSLVQDYLLDETNRFLLTGENLKFEFTPPTDLGYQQSKVWAHLKRDRPDDFAFGTEGVVLNCDPTVCQKFLDSTFEGLRGATRQDLDKDLEDYYSKQLKELREQRKEHPFWGYRLPIKPDHHYFSAWLKRSSKDQWIGLSFDNKAPWEVSIIASDYGRIIGYQSEETRKSGIDPYELELREEASARRFEIVALSGDVQVGVENAELLRADMTYRIRMKEQAQELFFALGSLEDVGNTDKKAGITVNALQDGEGQPLVYVRRGPTGGYVILPEEVPADTEITLRMAYETTGSIYKLTPSYSYLERESWLPFQRIEDKITDLELSVTAPAKYKTLSTGVKVSETQHGDTETTVWKAQNVYFPTIIFGRYHEDRPKTKATKSDGTEIPIMIHVDKDSLSDWGITLKSLRPLAEQAVNALNFYRERYGVDYPYGKLDLVNDLGGVGAQSPDSIVYVGSPVFLSEARLAQGSTNATYITEFVDSLIAHEVAHQWWGGVIGHRSSGHYWFVESLAEYSAALYLEFVESRGYEKPEKGRKAYLNLVDTWRKEILENDLMNCVQNTGVAWAGTTPGAARALIYAKGPYAFHILRETFGDEKFFPFLKSLAQEYAGQNIVTRDIQRVAEQSFGGTMEWFFDQWIRGVGIPEYTLQYDYRRAEDGNYIVEGNIKQRVVAGQKKFELDGVFYRGLVPVTVLGRDKQEYRQQLLVEGQETPFVLKVPVEPLEVAFNKYGEILAHPTVEN